MLVAVFQGSQLPYRASTKTLYAPQAGSNAIEFCVTASYGIEIATCIMIHAGCVVKRHTTNDTDQLSNFSMLRNVRNTNNYTFRLNVKDMRVTVFNVSGNVYIFLVSRN